MPPDPPKQAQHEGDGEVELARPQDLSQRPGYPEADKPGEAKVQPEQQPQAARRYAPIWRPDAPVQALSKRAAIRYIPAAAKKKRTSSNQLLRAECGVAALRLGLRDALPPSRIMGIAKSCLPSSNSVAPPFRSSPTPIRSGPF